MIFFLLLYFFVFEFVKSDTPYITIILIDLQTNKMNAAKME